MTLRYFVIIPAIIGMVACGQSPVEQTDRPIDTCLAEGGTLAEQGGIDNNLIVDHGELTAATVSPAGDLILASTDGSIKIWDVARGQLATEIQAGGGDPGNPYGEVTPGGAVAGALAITDDGGLLAAGDETGQVRFFDLDLALEQSVQWGTSPIASTAVSPDGALVAAADVAFGGNVRVWNPGTGELGEPLPTILWDVHNVHFLPDGRLLVAGHWYSVPMVEIWNLDTPDPAEHVFESTLATGAYTTLAVAADGLTVVAAGPGFAAVISLATGTPELRELSLPVDHDPVSIAITPAAAHFTSVGTDGRVRTWDLQTGEERQGLTTAGALWVAATPDDSLLVGASTGYIAVHTCRL